ncbi:MAG: hypothetical protein ACJ8EP_06610 [Sphingomicrobium sp.]
MGSTARRLLTKGAIPAGCALAALWASPATARSDLELFGANNFELSGDVRLVAVNGEESWVDGGFGKLRSGSEGDLRLTPQLGNASIVWKPQFTWSFGAVLVGSLQGGERTEAGLSQAYLTFHPMRSDKLAFSARAGLMWPPISLEHEGADWHVKDSITPSAINSWIGEEVRPVGAEGSLTAGVGEHKVRATAALTAANDTAGTLLSFRGWALHDRTTLAFHREPLPPFDGEMAEYQAPYTHPLLDVGPGFAHRPGYYVKLAWQPPIPVRVELFRYDNRANPEEANIDPEWGWRTAFNHIGLLADLGSGSELKAQAIAGRTRMGFREPDKRWVDNRFRSAFVMATRPFGELRISIRGDVFETRNSGSLWDDEYDESGWSAMLAAKREWTLFTGLIELLHVSSKREDREDVGLEPRQHQTQLQAELRMHW